jgi:hypothetical protein
MNMFDTRQRREHAVELLKHGAGMETQRRLVRAVTGAEVVDPSMSPVLRELGLGYVTTLIEDLSRHNLVDSPAPLNSRYGQWIGYRLTATGRQQAESPTLFRAAVVLREGMFPRGTQASIQTLLDEAERTLAVGAFCACVAMYGRVLESMCLALAIQRGIVKAEERVGFDSILNRLRHANALPQDDVLDKALELGKSFRNVAVHPSGWAALPSEIESELIATLPSRNDAELMQMLVNSAVQRLSSAPVA